MRTWWHALTQPADNVVAATLVLAGVLLTAAVTLVVSAAGRRHDLRKAVDARVAEIRDAAYVDAETLLLDAAHRAGSSEVWTLTEQEQQDVLRLLARLRIFGAKGASESLTNYIKATGEKKPPRELREISEAFDALVRKDVRRIRSPRS